MGRLGLRYLLLGIVSLALFASTAQADNARVARAQAIAVEHWGNVCDGKVKVTRGTLPRGMAGLASYRFNVKSPDRYYDCAMTFSRGRISWRKFCSVMVHEYGHLAGQGHSPDPADIMFPRYVKPFGGCSGSNPVKPF